MNQKTHVVFNGKRMTFYDFFEVEENATEEQMKVAYRKLCIRFHPDKHGGSELYQENFKAIQQLWGILGDKAKRANYDRTLAIERGVQPHEQGISIRFFYSGYAYGSGATSSTTGAF